MDAISSLKAFSISDKSIQETLVKQNSNFKVVFDFLNAHSISELANMSGKVILDGDNAFISFSENILKKPDIARLEAHNKYIDLQLVLKGSEKIDITPRSVCSAITEDRLAKDDVVFFAEDKQSYVVLLEGEYLVIPPETAHAPCVENDAACTKDIKAIAKILKQ